MSPHSRLRVVSDDPVVEAVKGLTAKVEALASETKPKPAENGGIYLPRWVLTIVAPVMTAALIGMGVALLNLSTGVAIIEGTLFTSGDALMMQRQLEREIEAVRRGPPTQQAELRLRRLEQIHELPVP